MPSRSDILPAVGVGHDEVAIRAAVFEIFEIADQHLFRRHLFEDRRPGRGDRRG